MRDVLLDNLEMIRSKIDEKTVTLLAVTKTVPVERINTAIVEGGVRCIGENRVQEFLQNYDHLAMRDEIDVHLIGSLQTNKVKYIIDKVDLIQSVDSTRLIDEIQKQAAKIGKVQKILIEINIGGEESKGGITPAELPEILFYLEKCPNVLCRGLMCIPPICEDEAVLSSYFQSMQKLQASFHV